MVRGTSTVQPPKVPASHVRWEQRACKNVDPDIFFDQTSEEEEVARTLCRMCPIRVECLTWALENSESYGMWGGMTEKQRRYIQTPRHRVKCPGCGSRSVQRDLLKKGVEVCSGCGLSWVI